MTIYGRGYREADYRPEPVWRRLWPIVSFEYRTLFRSRWGVALFVCCLLPSIVNMVVMLMTLGVLKIAGMQRRMSRGMGDQIARWLPDHLDFYVEPIVQESVALFLILTALVGCRAIAKDRASNALELYWTRGIGPRGYFVAKWMGSFLLLLLVAVVAPLLVWLTGVFVAEDWGFWQDTAPLVPRALLAHTLFVAIMAWLALAVSGLAQSPNFASVLWLLLIAGSGAVAGVLGELLRNAEWTRCLGLWQSLADFDRWVAGVSLADGVGRRAAVSLLVYAGVLSLLMLRRLRRQEAIA